MYYNVIKLYYVFDNPVTVLYQRKCRSAVADGWDALCAWVMSADSAPAWSEHFSHSHVIITGSVSDLISETLTFFIA